MQHTIPMPCYSQNYFTYGILHMPQRLSVPIFFLMSSYFFFFNIKKDPLDANKKFFMSIVRLLKLYVIWSIIHFIVNSYDWFSVTPFNVGGMKWYITYVVLWAKFGILWFMYSLIIGLILTYAISKLLPKQLLIVIAIFLSIFMGMGDAWYGFIIQNNILADIYNNFYTKLISMRSGLTYGLLFGIIGYLLAEKDLMSSQIHKITIQQVLLCICSFLMYTAEGFIAFRLGYPQEYGIYFFSAPTAILIFNIVKNLNLPLIKSAKYFRKSSALIYFIHMLFIFFWDRAFTVIGADNPLYRGILECIFVFVFSSYVSTLIYYLSNFRCFKFLKSLY